MIAVYLHGVIVTLSWGLFIYRYRKDSYRFLLNFHFYVLFFSIFYISLPSIVTVLFSYSPVGATIKTVNETAIIGLYFVFIFLIFYFFSKDKDFKGCRFDNIKSPMLINLVKFLATLITLYIVITIIRNIAPILDAYGNRALQSNLNHYFEVVYKIKPLFVIMTILISFLCLKKNSLRYFMLFLPFIMYEIMLSGRIYMLSILLVALILLTLKRVPLKLKYLFSVILLIASLSIFRMTIDFELGHILVIFYEFIFTWSTVHLMYESTSSQDLLYALNYSFFRIFPSEVYKILFGHYKSYTIITGEANPLAWGLAGSIVAEAISFKYTIITLAFPFLLSMFASINNYLLRTGTYTGIIIFIISISYIQQMFRFSFLEFLMYPFYVLIFLGSYIVVIDILCLARAKYKKET